MVAIPYAGGDRFSYRALQAALPEGLSLHVLELPGRGPSRKLPRLKAISHMVDELYAQHSALHIEGGYTLLGHSMGGILAYELLCKLHKEGKHLPQKAWISSIPAPSVKRERRVSQLESKEFWEVMRSYRGVPEAIIASEEMRNYFEPVLRDDFAAIEQYSPLAGSVQALPVRLHIAWGKEEHLDEAHMQPWADTSSIAVEFSTYPGHHFFLFQHLHEVVHSLTRAPH